MPIRRLYNSHKRRLMRGFPRTAQRSAFAYYANRTPYVANKALQTALQVKSLVNAEHKYHDTNVGLTTPTSSSIIQVLNSLAQGTTDSTRIGDSIKMTSLNVNFDAYHNFNSSSPTQNLRIIIFIWKKPSTAPTLDDILAPSSAASDRYLAPKNYDKRFWSKILYDKTFKLNEGGSSSAGYKIHLDFSKYKKYAHVQYAAASSSIDNNGLYMLTISGDATLAPALNYFARLKYLDN